MHNVVPEVRSGKYPIARFSATDVRPNPKHYQTFGCPAYVLDNALQAGQTIPKWTNRARVGIYLGQSRTHASSIGLILNTQTGLVSPQFHAKFDNLFETTNDPATKISRWQVATGFRTETVEPQAKRPANDIPLSAVGALPPPAPPIPVAPPVPNRHSDQPAVPAETAQTDTGEDGAASTELEGASSHTAESEPRPTRSGRRPRLTQRARESKELLNDGLVAWETTTTHSLRDYDWYEEKAQQDYEMQRKMKTRFRLQHQ